MRWTLAHAVCAAGLLLSQGCASSNFMVKKNDTGFFITSDRPELKLMLCDSGDMDTIVRDSRLPEALQKVLKEKVCADRKNRKELKSIFNEMTKEQLASLKDAFRKNGYDINKVADG